MTARPLSARLPLPLLLLALSTVFLFGADRGQFYRPGHHANVSAYNLAIATNLSPEHDWLMFSHRSLDADGRVRYEPYNRYPLGTFALIKLAILPFADDLSAQIRAARFLMLMFFAATVVLAYWSLCRLTASRWVALAAVLLAFSSVYCVYYSDLVSIEPPALFGVMLTFHGMVVFAQGGGFRQLLVRACLALFLGAWNVYALLLPFITLGVASELWRRRASHASSSSGPSIGAAGGLRACGRYIALGAATLLFGVSLLVFNLHNEYMALGGEVPLEETPTFVSATQRLNLARDSAFACAYADFAKYLEWPIFLKTQLHRVGGMSVPLALHNENLRFEAGRGPTLLEPPNWTGTLIGLGVLGVCVLALCRLRHKVLLAALVSSGFCWAVPLKHSVFIHDAESIYYVGVPMVFYASMLLYMQRRLGNRVAVACAGVALIVFISSSFQGVRLDRNTAEAERQAAVVADFEAIRGIAMKDRSVVSTSVELDHDLSLTYDGSAIMFYLAGRIFTPARWLGSAEIGKSAIDFIVTTKKSVNNGTPLTPDNRMVFLHRPSEEGEGVVRPDYGERIIHSYYDVYLDGNRLTYVSSTCTRDELDTWFFLHVFPVDITDLPEHRKQYGFDNRDFPSRWTWKDRRGQCVTPGNSWKDARQCAGIFHLPDYDIARIRTGQYIPGEGRLWEGEFYIPR